MEDKRVLVVLCLILSVPFILGQTNSEAQSASQAEALGVNCFNPNDITSGNLQGLQNPAGVVLSQSASQASSMSQNPGGSGNSNALAQSFAGAQSAAGGASSGAYSGSEAGASN